MRCYGLQQPEDGIIPSAGYVNDLDLKLLNSSGNSVVSSVSSYNNVEIIEYTVTAEDDYKICVRVHDHTAATTATYLKVITAWILNFAFFQVHNTIDNTI